MIAERVAMTMEFAAEFTTLSTKRDATFSRPVHARAARRAVDTNVTEAASNATVRRSNASASMPPYSPASTIGTSPATAIIDTANVLWVSSNTCSITATTVSWPPMPESVDPIHRRANAGEVVSGRRSISALPRLTPRPRRV